MPETSVCGNCCLVILSARLGTNLTVTTSAAVSKGVLARDSDGEVTAEGVDLTTPQTKTTQTPKARRKVVLAAGALNSPRILEFSGICCAKWLEEFRIDSTTARQALIWRARRIPAYLGVMDSIARHQELGKLLWPKLPLEKVRSSLLAFHIRQMIPLASVRLTWVAMIYELNTR